MRNDLLLGEYKMTIVELITIILFFFFFGYGLVRFFMDLTEYVAWRW